MQSLSSVIGLKIDNKVKRAFSTLISKNSVA